MRHSTYDFPGVYTPQGAGGGFGLNPRNDISPTDPICIIREPVNGRTADLWQWGRQTPRSPSPRVNARSDNLIKYYPEAFKSRRCLIPADAWYEWTAITNAPEGRKERLSAGLSLGGKQRWSFRVRDNELFYFAGIYGEGFRKDKKTGEWEKCKAVIMITTAANSQIAKTGHKRQPVIIQPDSYDMWLDSNYFSEQAHQAALASVNYDGLVMERVRGPVGISV